MRVMSFYLSPNERGSMPPGNFSQRSKTSMNHFERENMLRFSCARCVQFILFLHLSIASSVQEFGDSPEYVKIKFPLMPTERCAKLMVVGMVNKLDEIWISENPMLLGTYIKEYFPILYKWYVLIFLYLFLYVFEFPKWKIKG